jgi:hypothetical protein
MSISDEKPPQVPPPVDAQLRNARRWRERDQWIAYFAGVGAALPLVELWLLPALDLSRKTGYWVGLGVAVIVGFLTQALYNWVVDPPERSGRRDRDKAV